MHRNANANAIAYVSVKLHLVLWTFIVTLSLAVSTTKCGKGNFVVEVYSSYGTPHAE
jgi:hypothetical protein